MKRKIISMLMVMVILFTAVDMSAFASEAMMSSNEVQSVVKKVVDDAEKNKGEETNEKNVLGNERKESVKEKDVSESKVGNESFFQGQELDIDEAVSILTKEKII